MYKKPNQWNRKRGTETGGGEEEKRGTKKQLETGHEKKWKKVTSIRKKKRVHLQKEDSWKISIIKKKERDDDDDDDEGDQGLMNLKVKTQRVKKKVRPKRKRKEKTRGGAGGGGGAEKRKGCQQHPVFPGGHPSKY